jgi:ABC-type spermidine/putrescine transport system permease subunit II
MATFQQVDAVEVTGRPARRARRSWVRIAAVSVAAAVATLSVSLAIGTFAGAAVNALNPQPLPPVAEGGEAVLALNPQPIPPGVRGGTDTLA